MNHQLYEDWLITSYEEEGENLSAGQSAELAGHLKDCSSCARLAASWEAVEANLRSAPQAAPAPGFSARWQARLALERRRTQQRQTALSLGLSLAGVALVSAGMLAFAWPLLRAPEVLFWAWVYQMIGLLGFAEQAGGLLANLLQTGARVMPVAGWVLFAGVLTQLGVLWVASYRLLTIPRRISK
jgi:anti-sigma factor RsiW